MNPIPTTPDDSTSVSTATLDPSFTNGSGSDFTVYGPVVGSDSAVLTAGENFTWGSYAAYLAYQADLGAQNYRNQTVLIGFRIRW